jgi:hypothetical protein
VGALLFQTRQHGLLEFVVARGNSQHLVLLTHDGVSGGRLLAGQEGLLEGVVLLGHALVVVASHVGNSAPRALGDSLSTVSRGDGSSLSIAGLPTHALIGSALHAEVGRLIALLTGLLDRHLPVEKHV